MRTSAGIGIFVMLLLTACSGMSSKQEEELVENGYTAMSGGDYYTAEYLLKQALRINDKNPYALLNLGVVYQETNRLDQAREAYQTVIDLNPSETAVASNVEEYAGNNLVDIARTNLENLPPAPTEEPLAQGASDEDNDGVMDNEDQCDTTPENAIVGANGCWTLVGIFPSGMTSIGPDAHAQLDHVTMVLQENPSLRVEIQGHTDNMGSASANKRLSEKRAQSVVLYLIEQGVEAERLEWEGYGQTQPMASNDTAKGREQNRRVQLNPLPSTEN